MAAKTRPYQIIPAQPGYFTVVDYGGSDGPDLAIGDPIIAWRIETHNVKNSDDIFSVCIALTVDGDMPENCIGVQNPDKTVTAYSDVTYQSLDALKAERQPRT